MHASSLLVLASPRRFHKCNLFATPRRLNPPSSLAVLINTYIIAETSIRGILLLFVFVIRSCSTKARHVAKLKLLEQTIYISRCNLVSLYNMKTSSGEVFFSLSFVFPALSVVYYYWSSGAARKEFIFVMRFNMCNTKLAYVRIRWRNYVSRLRSTMYTIHMYEKNSLPFRACYFDHFATTTIPPGWR